MKVKRISKNAEIVLAHDELLVLNALLHEVCNRNDAFAFKTRIGADRAKVERLASDVQAVLDQTKENSCVVRLTLRAPTCPMESSAQTEGSHGQVREPRFVTSGEAQMNSTKAAQTAFIKRDLFREAENLFSWDESNFLGLAVRRLFPDLVLAFVLYWLPEQEADIYWVLVSPAQIAMIEIPRDPSVRDRGASFEMTSVEAYKHRRLSREARRKLAVALGLIADGRANCL
jgi:hypothetical protein